MSDHGQRQLHRTDDDCDVAMAGIHAPEPWREPPPRQRKFYASSRDPLSGQAETGNTEISWGEGLMAPHANGQPPSKGGQYMPKCPPVELHGLSLTPRQKRRPPNEARGYPGNQVAR